MILANKKKQLQFDRFPTVMAFAVVDRRAECFTSSSANEQKAQTAGSNVLMQKQTASFNEFGVDRSLQAF